MAHKISFYLDEHLGHAVSEGLRIKGVDVLTTLEAGMQGTSDSEQFQYAISRQRVLVTKDNDYLRLSKGDPNHCGIVFINRAQSIGEIVKGLMLIYEVLDADEMRGTIEYM